MSAAGSGGGRAAACVTLRMGASLSGPTGADDRSVRAGRVGRYFRPHRRRKIAYRTRVRALAEVPTTAEAAYPDIVFDNWFGVFVPAGTPGEIISYLNREIAGSMALPDVAQRLVALGFEPVGSSPQQFAGQIDIELEIWAKVIRAANIRAQ
jgi:tripartite-type tricarboxylate transporter receptor subunit TctC